MKNERSHDHLLLVANDISTYLNRYGFGIFLPSLYASWNTSQLVTPKKSYLEVQTLQMINSKLIAPVHSLMNIHHQQPFRKDMYFNCVYLISPFKSVFDLWFNKFGNRLNEPSLVYHHLSVLRFERRCWNYVVFISSTVMIKVVQHTTLLISGKLTVTTALQM